MATTTIDTGKSKDIIIIVAIVILIIIMIPVIKSIANMLKGLGDTLGTDILGISNSDAKRYVNKVYASGSFPLFSNYFTKMQATQPANAVQHLKTVSNYRTIADQLWNDMGIAFDNESDAIHVFDYFTSQFSVALFAKVFNDYKGRDLFEWLRKSDKLFAQGFNAETVYQIVKKVESLPKY